MNICLSIQIKFNFNYGKCNYGKCYLWQMYYGKFNFGKVFMAKVSWQMKLSPRTVSVISSDPPCKYRNGRFTTIQLKTMSYQVCNIYLCL